MIRQEGAKQIAHRMDSVPVPKFKLSLLGRSEDCVHAGRRGLASFPASNISRPDMSSRRSSIRPYRRGAGRDRHASVASAQRIAAADGWGWEFKVPAAKAQAILKRRTDLFEGVDFSTCSTGHALTRP
jgi:hypothetical protein